MDNCVGLLIIMMLNHNKVGYTVYKNQLSPDERYMFNCRLSIFLP